MQSYRLARRDFLKTAMSAVMLPPALGGRDTQQPASQGWRTFEVTTRVNIARTAGATRVWLPAALIEDTPYQRTLTNDFYAPGGSVRLTLDRQNALGIVVAEFPGGRSAQVTLVSRVATRDHAVDLRKPSSNRPLAPKQLQHFLRPTKLIPIDGIVRRTALEITKGAKRDVDRARAIYDWIVENTFRDPDVQGCGLGDIRYMLESRNLGGKCADLNALFVGLARSVGLPARDAYGLRVAPSSSGYRSLGTSSAVVTRAQHCRAEVYLDDYGWTPVDPADVRKVALEEPPGNRPLDDAMVTAARERLFGAWEMNWIAYNFAHDVELPGSKRAVLPFLMYPQAETEEGRRDSLSPDDFQYEIEARVE